VSFLYTLQDIQSGVMATYWLLRLLKPVDFRYRDDGNKAISSEDLLKGLNQSGLAEGEIFQRATRKVCVTNCSVSTSPSRYSAEIEAK
jgi:outer membrane protein insertion porin family